MALIRLRGFIRHSPYTCPGGTRQVHIIISFSYGSGILITVPLQFSLTKRKQIPSEPVQTRYPLHVGYHSRHMCTSEGFTHMVYDVESTEGARFSRSRADPVPRDYPTNALIATAVPTGGDRLVPIAPLLIDRLCG